MSQRLCLVIPVVVAGGLLLAGCRGVPSAGVQPGGQEELTGESRSGAAEAGKELLAKQAKAHAHYAAAVVLALNNERDAALDEYCEAVKNDPDDETLVIEVTGRLLEAKKPEKALELLQVAASRSGASSEVLARLGFVYFQLGKQDQAIQTSRTAIKRDPQLVGGYHNLYLAYVKNKQPEQALRVLDDAAKVPKTDTEFLLGLGEMYASYARQYPTQREKVNAKGLATLARVDRAKLTSLQFQLRLADQLAAFGSEARAAEVYLQLLKELDDYPPLRDRVRATLTDIYLRTSDRKGATEQLKAIVRDDPSNAVAYYCLGVFALEDGQWADATEQLSKAILFEPRLDRAYYALAEAQIVLGQATNALTTLKNAQEKFAATFALEQLYGAAYSQQKDYAQAIKHFTTAEVIAQATTPERLTDKTYAPQRFYFQVGSTFERKGDYEQAAKYFEKAIQFDPDFADALNYLGYMWAERGTNLVEARDMIERALKVEPKNPAFLDSMGWVLFKQNKPREALDYIQKAVDLSEKPDATVLDHLGDIHAALSETEKARDAWRKSLELEPNEQIRKKLDGGG